MFWSIPMLSASQLDSWLDKTIGDICLNGYSAANDNHCAHFISHALSLSFGYTCQHHTGGRNLGANLRVHEVFAQCSRVQEIRECGGALSGIAFVSAEGNFVSRGSQTTLRNVPKKHVGLLLGGIVWHYSNTQDKVVKQPMSQFLFHYRNQANALWLGALPAGARALWFGQC
jgi:hypothetical protein